MSGLGDAQALFDPAGMVIRKTGLPDPLGIYKSDSEDPSPLPVAPSKASDEVEQAAAKERAEARKRRGRESTILTSAMATDNAGRKTLLGQ